MKKYNLFNFLHSNNYKNFKPFYNRYIKDNLNYYLEIFFALFFANIITLIIPLILKIIIDDAFIAKDVKLLFILASIIAITTILIEIGTSISRYFYIYLIEQINYKAISDIYYHILKLPLNFFDNIRVGEVMKRINDAKAIHGFMSTIFFNFLNNLLLIIINISACFFINPYVGIVLLLYIIFFIFYNKKIGKISNESENKKWDQDKIITSEQNESIVGIRTIKVFGNESKVSRKVKWLILKLRELKMFYERKYVYWNFLFSSVLSLESFLIIVISGLFIIFNRMTLGEFIAFQTISNRVFQPLKSLIEINKNFQSHAVKLNRLNETFNFNEEKQKTTKKLNITEGNIKFENLNFEYFKGQNVLKNINLEIKNGKKVAFIGMSGVGKSTIANLIAKFYTPSSGRILINNIDINDYDVKTLRENIGFVLQNTYLFDGTILDNLQLCAHNKSLNEIYNACKKACAHDFIINLKDQYNTKVGEQGVKLSGGQKQRIAIAQAILKDPKILILDEATSHLDLETEEDVQNALNNLMKNKTSIIIAHRLSTIQKADYICVLEKGKIIEIGKHNELIKKNTYYKKMYNKIASI